jgi:septal ring factor EnvC (AmiA/AmiB activator)|tara:strand:- start:468 stop:629 length:162 start_codon:yes stop_codon:yes gene_type:complete
MRTQQQRENAVKQIEQLQEEVEALKLQVAEEVKEKYQLYKRIKDLTKTKDPIL